MIEVNLLPGAKRGKKSSGGPAINFAAIGASISERVKDKWLAAAVVSGLVSALVIGFLFMGQRSKTTTLREAEAAAVADSARFAAVLRDRRSAEARRDSVLLQLNIIRAIDDERFVWPRMMDEISRALPPYTWLVSINNQIPQGTNPAASVRLPAPDTSARARRRPARASTLPEFKKDSVRVRLTGRTVDLQAMTRFYRNLEDSPFLGAVQLQSSEVVAEGERPVHQFVMDVSYSRPDTTQVRRVPLTIPR